MILLNDFKRQWTDTGNEVLECVRHVGESGWYVLGEQVAAFERELASYWGVSEAVGVASGLDALELSLRILGCGPGQRVLTTAVSAFATVLAILKTGAIPIFADCCNNGLIDFESCRRVLDRDRNIRFFIPVHLYGHSLELDAISRLRQEFGLHIIEDCAQSIGAAFHGRSTGSAGELAATSFYPTKNLGAIGDGGAVLTNNPEHAASLRVLRDYGQTAKYRHDAVGYNSRLDELHAAILRGVYLPRLNGWIARRREIAKRYREGIHHPCLCVPSAPSGSESCYHLFPILAAENTKPSLIAHLRANEITTGEHYPIAIPDQRVMAGLSFSGEFDRARRFCASEISLPIHPYLSDDEIEQVVGACNGWKP